MEQFIKGWYTYDIHFEGKGGGGGKPEMLSDIG